MMVCAMEYPPTVREGTTQVTYQDERTRTYLGSPSIVRLDDGALIVSHDHFGPGCPRNHEGEESLTAIHRSDDDGVNWRPVTHIMNQYWSSLFVLDGVLYILGTSQQYGSIHIRRSMDGGFTWSHVADAGSGLLAAGGYYHDPPNYHCAPVPVLVHAGRVWKAFEDCDPCVWGTGFQACVISAPVGADLLDAGSWTMTNKIRFDPAWRRAYWGPAEAPGWREGNVVAAPDGSLRNILAFEARPMLREVAARCRISAEGSELVFQPETGFVDFPGAKAKFTIRRDPATGRYLSIVNDLVDAERLAEKRVGHGVFSHVRQRNVSSLVASTDLVHWRRVATVLDDRSGLEWEDSIRLTGFQYTDWQFDGEDIVYAVRTAYRGARNFHDSNRILFGKVRGFRSLIAATGC